MTVRIAARRRTADARQLLQKRIEDKDICIRVPIAGNKIRRRRNEDNITSVCADGRRSAGGIGNAGSGACNPHCIGEYSGAIGGETVDSRSVAEPDNHAASSRRVDRCQCLKRSTSCQSISPWRICLIHSSFLGSAGIRGESHGIERGTRIVESGGPRRAHLILARGHSVKAPCGRLRLCIWIDRCNTRISAKIRHRTRGPRVARLLVSKAAIVNNHLCRARRPRQAGIATRL